MDALKNEELWFNTPDSNTLCRGGGNGPNHPSQLYAIKKYVDPRMSILDYGSGSATTWEALRGMQWPPAQYCWLDVIEKNTNWCQENFPETSFLQNKMLHKIPAKKKRR